jgi:hypothetical protein
MQYNQPFDQPTNPNAAYVNGNPSTGTPGSIPPAAAIEYPQREIANLIADVGLTPTNSDLHQLGKGIQTGKLFYAVDTSGVANTVAVTLVPAPSAYVEGMSLKIKMANAPTGPSTITANGLAAKAITVSGGSAVGANAWKVGDVVSLVFDGTNFQLQNIAGAGGSVIYYGHDIGSTNNIAVSPTPTPVAYVEGMILDVKLANSVTGATVINVSSLGVKSVIKGDGSALSANTAVAGEIIRLIYDGTKFQLENVLSTNFRATSYQVYASVGSYTWTCPAGVTQVKIRMCGAGGGGGAGVNFGGGAGGNGGSYAELIYNVSPGSNYSVVIGGGGGGGGGAGGAGGTTSFNGVLTITGGGGGLAGNGTGGSTGGSSAVSGSSQFAVTGGTGQYGSGNAASLAQGGAGGGSVFQAPQFSPICFSGGPLNGYTSGSGAAGSGGASSNGSTGIGGAGGDGVIILEF